LIIILKLLVSVWIIVGGIIALSAGIKKERKAFFWLSGYGRIIKNPTFNIIYGVALILIGITFFLLYVLIAIS
jgi:hypothetical protein